MEFSLEKVADVLDGIVEGDNQAKVSRLSKIEEAAQGDLTFLSNPKYTDYIYETKATAVIVNKDFNPKKQLAVSLIKVEDAHKAFANILKFYDEYRTQSKEGIEQSTYISESASYGKKLYLGAFSYIDAGVQIGNNVKIYPNVYIGNNVSIGNDVIIYSGCHIHSDTIIGNDCRISSGSVIGSDGFGFLPNKEGTYDKVPQIGNVIIEDNVDIGACVTIDRATLGSSVIKEGVKLDNQIHIAHNVVIGEHTVMAAQTGIAGSSKIGKYCRIGGQVGISGHLTIADKVNIQAQSGITKNQKEGVYIQGTPAFDYRSFNKSYVYFKNLPKILGRSEKENI